MDVSQSYISDNLAVVVSRIQRTAVIGGLQETIRLCKDCHDAFVLRALGKVVVAMVPFPDDLLVRRSCPACSYDGLVVSVDAYLLWVSRLAHVSIIALPF